MSSMPHGPPPPTRDEPGEAGPGLPGWQPGLERNLPLPEPTGNGSGAGARRDERVDQVVLERWAATAPPVQPAVAERPLVLHTLTELLANPAALQPPQAVVPRCAWCGRVTLVVGREKLGGKSTLLTAGAAAVTRGGDFLDARTTAGAVLWVTADQEHASEIVQRALRFGAARDAFHVLWPGQEPFADVLAAMDRLHPFPALVVIDTLASFARTLVSDPHSSAEWPGVLLPLIRLARECDVALNIAHHATKSPGGGYRDSTAIGALVDMLLELEPDPGNPAVRHVKALGRWPASSFAVELVDDAYRLLAAGALTLDAKVLAFIAQHPRTNQLAIRAAMGCKHEESDAALARLIAGGAVRDERLSASKPHAYVAVQAATPSDDADVPF